MKIAALIIVCAAVRLIETAFPPRGQPLSRPLSSYFGRGLGSGQITKEYRWTPEEAERIMEKLRKIMKPEPREAVPEKPEKIQEGTKEAVLEKPAKPTKPKITKDIPTAKENNIVPKIKLSEFEKKLNGVKDEDLPKTLKTVTILMLRRMVKTEKRLYDLETKMGAIEDDAEGHVQRRRRRGRMLRGIGSRLRN